MRALTIAAHGGLEQVTFRDDVPMPDITRPGDVRVRLRAAALNHLDLWTVGGLPGVTITPPWVLGADGCGVIESVGAAVRSVQVGERVAINSGISCRECAYCRRGEQPLCVRYGILGEHHPGTFGEYIVLPAANVRRIPDSLPDDVAAAASLATLTAWRAIVTRAQVQAGDEVLIWGIGGGVAQQALQIAKARGARVWVTSSSADKLARAKAMGADELLNHREVEVGKVIRERTKKRGVDVVVDSVGEKTWAQSLMALGRGGRLVTYGGTSGPSLVTDVRRLFWNQWTILGSTMGNDAEFEMIVAELSAGRLWPAMDATYPLERGVEALRRLEQGDQFGKIVLRIADA